MTQALILRRALASFVALVIGASACRSARPGGSLVETDAGAQASVEVPAPSSAARPQRTDPAAAAALRFAIAQADVEATRRLLDSGVDPNARLADGTPVASWLGAGQRVVDDDLLTVATMLARYRCAFEDRTDGRGTGLLTNLAHRHVPKTLAFVGSHKEGRDCSVALKAIAGQDDLASVEALLGCGADPLWGRAGLSSSLFDAASRGSVASVAAMLKRAPSLTDPKAEAAYRAARDPETRKAFVDAGFKPSPASPAVPGPRPHELPPDVASLLTRLGLPNANGLAGLAGDPKCWLVERCGDLAFVDCNSAADGPAYYLDTKSVRLLATCGGACMRGCQNCPPKEWTCARGGPSPNP